MKKNVVLEEINKYLIEEGYKNNITLNSRFSDDLGMDSLDKLMLFNRLEEKFKVRFFDDENFHVYGSVGDVLRAVSEAQKNIKIIYPPKGSGVFYLRGEKAYCAITDVPCNKIDVKQASNSWRNQCKMAKCQIFENQNTK